MEKHIEIALANAEAALQFIDPWARVIAVQDDVRMARVLEKEAENPLNQAIAIMAYRRPEMVCKQSSTSKQVLCDSDMTGGLGQPLSSW